MGVDSLAENTPNAPEFIRPICLLKPKSSGFQWKKASLGVHSQWNLLSSSIVKVTHHHLELLTNQKQNYPKKIEAILAPIFLDS